MSQWLRDALLELLELHMAEHIERGHGYDEALMLGVAEIRHQIRESRGDLVTMLVDDAVLQARYAREAGKFLSGRFPSGSVDRNHKTGTQVH